MRRLWSDPGHATPADLAACREALRQGSRTFWAASTLLPPRVREPACSLYAFCRLADDAVDLGADADAALDSLRERLHRAYAGRPFPDPVDRALADVVERHGLPRALPEALLEGFAWDAAGRRYETLDDLEAYAARVAGTVGAMMAVLMGARSPALVARACDLGVAMQLTNIARDVGEDARNGRLYLPLSWMRDAGGLDPDAWMVSPAFDERLAAVVQRLLARAAELYARSAPGVAALPWACRPGIEAARLLYAAIGDELARRHGLDSVAHRAVVPLPRKLALLARALVPPPAAATDARPLAATRFLVAAVAAAPPPPERAAQPPPWWNLAERLAWVLLVFERLEQERRGGAAGRGGADA